MDRVSCHCPQCGHLMTCHDGARFAWACGACGHWFTEEYLVNLGLLGGPSDHTERYGARGLAICEDGRA